MAESNEEVKIVEQQLMKAASTAQHLSSFRLLAHPMDVQYLNPFHCFVRQQIEVFQATQSDLKEPAPGRKSKIREGSIGIRCIHCCHQPVLLRARRAIAYPKSLSRVYSIVSDMKLEHFNSCTAIPPSIKSRFLDLKEEWGNLKTKTKGVSAARGGSYDYYSGIIGQYYYDACEAIGLKDHPDSGVVLSGVEKGYNCDLQNNSSGRIISSVTKRRYEIYPLSLLPAVQTTEMSKLSSEDHDRILLSMVDDNKFLNPIHCFVRKNIEFFVISPEHAKEPSPGRKNKFREGYVGLRCIHCSSSLPEQRGKRATAYPASLSRIYMHVRNMKSDHFAICRKMPVNLKQEFLELSAARSREPRSSNHGSCITYQYYADSAAKLGLRDSDHGVVLTKTSTKSRSLSAQKTMCDADVTYNRPRSVSSGSSDSDGMMALAFAASISENLQLPRQANITSYSIPFRKRKFDVLVT